MSVCSSIAPVSREKQGLLLKILSRSTRRRIGNLVAILTLSKSTWLWAGRATALVHWNSHVLGVCLFSGGLDSRRSLPDDFSLFHDKENPLGRSDVISRIAWHRNDVSEFPFFQRTGFLRDTEKLGVIGRSRSECFDW